ncbi:uracil-DNA glycosylase [Microbulbifer agarilyticus]|uniref:uracil-DNA glycosylase n=1 Tax=Microbulbifer agarilyticus TaxID=260552 RepID=UPI001CD3232E|nr:uracil-DNA glycosylase [Microbulbifer agarilyticus]MCA0900672.1 uracil-DNA glycosylase [Microbulbifer agarilyticus]
MQVPEEFKIHPSWYTVLESQFGQPYMTELRTFLQQEKQAGKSIFPPSAQVFNAFNSTPFDQVKVVILGQDPYHGAGQAHGLCFSVMPGVRVPPSLKNIYKEMESDLGIAPPNHGCLQPWAEQGVLLLNTTLTVEESKAGAHQGRGWEQFTDAAVHALAEQRDGLVFILWGSYAQKKGGFINDRRHLVLRGPHPSPLSAHRGFFGTRPFSQANAYLQQRGGAPIDWSLPPAETLQRVAVEI